MTWTSLQGAQRGFQRPMCIGTERAQTHYLFYPILFYAGGYNTKNVCICGNITHKQAIELQTVFYFLELLTATL